MIILFPLIYFYLDDFASKFMQFLFFVFFVSPDAYIFESRLFFYA